MKMTVALTKLNKLLQNNGRAERFVLEKESFRDKIFDLLVLYHKTDKQKKMEFVCENGGGILHYLDSHDHFDCFKNDFDVERVFERVCDILDDKIVTFYEVNKDNKPVIGGSILLDLNIDSFKYTEEERKYLFNSNIRFQIWSGNITENIKLFVIGNVYTDMPEIEEKRFEESFLQGPFAEFGIIEEINLSKDYGKYEPQKYNLIKIQDSAINYWFPEIRNLKTYFHKLSRPEKGLARCGVTLIPPESLDVFYDIVAKHTPDIYETRQQLLEMILKAKQGKKFMIHFGI